MFKVIGTVSLNMKILKNISLKPYNTFGIDVKASYFARIESFSQLKSLLQNPKFKLLPLLVLGGGSNVLLCDDFNGLVIKIDTKGIEDLGNAIIKVQAGECWHDFVLWSLSNGFNGIENLSLIPGNVGTAPIQNIGAYGVELKSSFVELEAFDIDHKETRIFSKSECKFGYRDSIFKKQLKNKYIILSVTFKLQRDGIVNTDYGAISEVLKSRSIKNPKPKDVSEAVISIRNSKIPDPKQVGNSGSFFKNPIISKAHFSKIKSTYPNIPFYPIDDSVLKVPAAWLIEKTGWKGKRFANYGVHHKQALVLVNYSDASGESLFSLANDIIESVNHKFNIRLEMEVNIIRSSS